MAQTLIDCAGIYNFRTKCNHCRPSEESSASATYLLPRHRQMAEFINYSKLDWTIDSKCMAAKQNWNSCLRSSRLRNYLPVPPPEQAVYHRNPSTVMCSLLTAPHLRNQMLCHLPIAALRTDWSLAQWDVSIAQISWWRMTVTFMMTAMTVACCGALSGAVVDSHFAISACLHRCCLWSCSQRRRCWWPARSC